MEIRWGSWLARCMKKHRKAAGIAWADLPGGFDPGPEEPPIQLACLSGPLMGRTFSIGREGLMFGKDTDCGVQFPPDTQEINRHHCAIRWMEGVPVLMDLGSRQGTYSGEGRKLAVNIPVPIMPGNEFYLANSGYRFQVVSV